MTSPTPAPRPLPTRRGAVVLDFAERAGWTAGQQFMAVLLATGTAGSTVGLPWKLAIYSSVGAALASVLTTAVVYLPAVARRIRSSYWRDVVVRLAKTFLASLVGSVVGLALDVRELDLASVLDLAAITTLQALAKGLLARGAGDLDGSEQPSTPSTLASSTYQRAGGRH